jgi:hypothetical protein
MAPACRRGSRHSSRVYHSPARPSATPKSCTPASGAGRTRRRSFCITDDARHGGYAERKAALRDQVARAGGDAQAIFAADKVTKARELRAELSRGRAQGVDPAIEQRLEHYDASVVMLEREAPDLALVRQLRFELWALRALPPRTD